MAQDGITYSKCGPDEITHWKCGPGLKSLGTAAIYVHSTCLSLDLLRVVFHKVVGFGKNHELPKRYDSQISSG